MHELAIAQCLVELAAEHARRAGARCVTRLNCRIGALRQVDGELIRGAFEVARAGSPCKDAELNIETVPLRAWCEACAERFTVAGWAWTCPRCGRTGVLLDGGDELELVSIDAEGAVADRGGEP